MEVLVRQFHGTQGPAFSLLKEGDGCPWKQWGES